MSAGGVRRKKIYSTIVSQISVAGRHIIFLESFTSARLSQFAEFCHDSENISPLEATIAHVVRYVAWVDERGHIGAKSLQPYLSAINTFFELHNLDPIVVSLHLTASRRWLTLRQRRLKAFPIASPSAY
eukprot:jgi/Tetstr1/429131/TSEL_019093.t1